ncbi:hypothetical protein SEA_SICARIUS2_60 [Arthrobacter phage Sicarius2]|uniref:Uncharacterized protein n=1 Tax=Arthrobacter phage Sicarius2 TaxID=2836090 RepID=A0A8F3IMV8_9CAUD|nr:hypothetical protein SEA_SICARIUS2_60 [Arthrobacter phage Sicarius2]
MKLKDTQLTKITHSRIIECDGSQITDCGRGYADDAKMTVDVLYLQRADGEPFDQVTVKGCSVNKDGKRGKTSRTRFYFLRNAENVPEWLTELLKEG